MPNKICRVVVADENGANVVVREDGQEWPAERYIYADDDGVVWLWDGPQINP